MDVKVCHNTCRGYLFFIHEREKNELNLIEKEKYYENREDVRETHV